MINKPKKSNSIDIEYDSSNAAGAMAGGIAAGTYGTVNKSFDEERFHSRQGHGYAAERANNLFDKLTGHDAHIVGDNNEKNGADRIVDGVYIQSKYCATGSRCINECFEDKGEGNFRYMKNGKPMQIEVPSDKYCYYCRRWNRRMVSWCCCWVCHLARCKYNSWWTYWFNWSRCCRR